MLKNWHLGHDDGTHWQHPRSKWPRKMEDSIIDFYGTEDWHSKAEDRESWRKCSYDFQAWVVHRWGGHPPVTARGETAAEGDLEAQEQVPGNAAHREA